jgi:hypothetical protein
MQQSATTNNLTLDEVNLHFDHWRATRAKRGKIPGLFLIKGREDKSNYYQ